MFTGSLSVGFEEVAMTEIQREPVTVKPGPVETSQPLNNEPSKQPDTQSAEDSNDPVCVTLKNLNPNHNQLKRL